MQRVILMCAGRAARWRDFLGVPKHLVEVGGERLLDRTVRLVKERIEADVFVAAFDPAYDLPGTTRFEPDHGPHYFTDTDKFLSSAELWSPDDRTVLLYGDVFFTEEAMDAVAACREPYSFFGRPGPSVKTGKRWREMFALSFSPAAQAKLHHAMLAVRHALLYQNLQRGGGWEVYRALHGQRPVFLRGPRCPVGESFTTIDDFTDDFDFPADYKEWLNRYRSRGAMSGV